ncbi:hypothetical protein [Sneathiella limimaris]|uniref:hypothetical protein n=1 Tax=Sneathiella limimaris TaxID=1964213 RepID=UPI00146DF2EF|nr:hypothetical protein [Sneathiella limimaris]
MPNLFDHEDVDCGNAASLARIQVRKPSTDQPVMPATPKAGDITERLALLSQELDQTQEAPASTTSKPTAAPTPMPMAKPVRNTGWGPKKPAAPDILNYWLDIRQGRRYPSWRSLEPEKIGQHWPNCLLIHCNREIGRMQVKYEFTTAIRKVAEKYTPEEQRIDRIEFTPMVIDWILGLGREVATTGKPTHGTDRFPSLTGEMPIRLIALPLSEDLKTIDHVLCYIQQLKN